MLKTIEGVVDEQNNIRLLEDVPLKPAQRVLVTLLDTDSILDILIRQFQSAEMKAIGLAQFDQLRSRVLELRDEEALTEEEIQEEVNAYRRERGSAMRAVLDTNVAVSGLLFAGNPEVLLQKARNGLIGLFTSHALLLELSEVIERHKFMRRMKCFTPHR